MKTKVLSDHKLVGGKLIPPFYKMFDSPDKHFIETDYLNEVLPEIIWQGFLNNKWGVQVAAKITLSILEEINSARTNEERKSFFFISDFELLTIEQREKVLSKLFSDQEYAKIIEAILPFLKCFPECPLKVLLLNPISEFSIADVTYVKSVIKPLLDKTSKESTFAFANTIYYAIQMGFYSVYNSSPLLNLNQIESYPDTDESQRIAGNLRTSIKMFVQDDFMIKMSSKWRNYFWNQAHKLEPNNIDNLNYY